ncbi:hypothetical protein [Rhabdochromatium marinum]|uniref:hypothetical protein n=1 Tax=Rhabdochromatium marinum TaxID=48729 RepID=UPI001902D527|nr:hypothetical protein [Rhabdochromatium marinum]MBK1648536.1 hypothetical protein [Rhabdochromatium marinum]
MQDYQIIFAGIKPGVDAKQARWQLLQLFGISRQELDELISCVPVVLQTGLAAEVAWSLRDRIRDAGGVCRASPVDSAAFRLKSQFQPTTRSSQPAAPASEPPFVTEASSIPAASEPEHESAPVIAECPKCGYQAHEDTDPLLTAYAGMGECPVCGIIVAKYNLADDPSALTSVPAKRDVWDDDDEPLRVAPAERSHRAWYASRRLWLGLGACGLLGAGGLLLQFWSPGEMGKPSTMVATASDASGEVPAPLSHQHRLALQAAGMAADVVLEQHARMGQSLSSSDLFVDPDPFLPASLRQDPWQTPYRLSVTARGHAVLVSAGPNQHQDLQRPGGDDVLVFGHANDVLVLSLSEPLPRLFKIGTKHHCALLMQVLLNAEDPQIAGKAAVWLREHGYRLSPAALGALDLRMTGVRWGGRFAIVRHPRLCSGIIRS